MRILVATDAWHPQVNGVVRTLTTMAGPRDVIGAAPVGALNDDLRAACLSAMTISPQACREFAAGHSWEASARAFVDNMTDIRPVDQKTMRYHSPGTIRAS